MLPQYMVCILQALHCCITDTAHPSGASRALTLWHLGHLKLLRSGLGFSAGRRCASSAPSNWGEAGGGKNTQVHCRACGSMTRLS